MKPGNGEWIRCYAVTVPKVGVGLVIGKRTTFDETIKGTCYDVKLRSGKIALGCILYPLQEGFRGALLRAFTPDGRTLCPGPGAQVRRASSQAVAHHVRRERKRKATLRSLERRRAKLSAGIDELESRISKIDRQIDRL